ncbi:MAG: iron ABC transporter permease [Acidobacteria bacterium]|nr:MAG: iron ABC transporter permease [Acidobacteriota bacterium]PYQ64309.1 MAG: iron ABC transporter permease [Acidobacteriota bacterium]
MTRRSLAAALLALLLLWLVGYPLLVTLTQALEAPRWTLRHFVDFARRPEEWRALWASIWISLVTVGLAAAIGVPLAFLFERADFPGRRVLGSLVALPVVLPPLVGVIAFLFLYGESGFVARAIQSLFRLDAAPWRLAGPAAVLLVHAYTMYVYFYLFTRAGLARLDAALLEAAEGLGAGPRTVLTRVTLPLLSPALTGAALLTFMTSLASFSAPYVFGGGFRVMTTQIVASKLNGDLPAAMVETVTLAVVALVGLALLQRSETGRVVAGGGRGVAPARRRLGRSRWLVAAFGWALAAFLLLPHATLVLVSLVPRSTWTIEILPPVLNFSNYAALLSEPERLRPLVNSLWMAVVATAGALVLGFAAARLAVRGRTPLGGALETLLAIPWALPGTVFAVALSATFSVHAPWVGRFVLVGTAAILPLGYLVRNLPVTGRATFGGFRQLDPALDEAASSLGAGWWKRLSRIDLPLLAPALAAGASLAFLTALGDFVISIVLYTYETRPISIEILSSLRLQETGAAAAYGVVLAALSAAVFFLWGRRADEMRPPG